MTAVSFSGPNSSLSLPEPRYASSDKKTAHGAASTNMLAIPTQVDSDQPIIRIHLPKTEDVFEKAPKKASPDDLVAPMLMLTTDDDDGALPQFFVPDANNEDDATRLNHGRDWNVIEAEAVHKEKFRQVLSELQGKHGHQLPVGEQDKTDEENLNVMTEELGKRKAQGDSSTKAFQGKETKKGHISLDA